jgi:excisionase family DNA binding protein
MTHPVRGRGRPRSTPASPPGRSIEQDPAPPADAAPGQHNPRGAQEVLLPLYTAAGAAQLLAVRESWLRRAAAARAVPCTFLGKHLRFSHADVHAIAAAAARPVTAPGALTAAGSSARAARSPRRR